MGEIEAAWTQVVGLGFVLWWLASAVHQLPPTWWKHVTAHDRFRLLPQWHFFAPRPGRRDHHLLIRDIVEGRPGSWREVPVGEARQAWRWIWNPQRFRQKALVDLVNSLNSTRRLFIDNGVGKRSEELSLPYLGLLAWVCAQPAQHRPCLRQFVVVASSGHGAGRDLRVVYLSEAHSVPAD